MSAASVVRVQSRSGVQACPTPESGRPSRGRSSTERRARNTMSHMTKASVGALMRHRAQVLQQLEQGNELAITKHGRVVARLVPGTLSLQDVHLPDSAARMQELLLKATDGASASWGVSTAPQADRRRR